MTREREVKSIPGGYLGDPPKDCPKQATYRPPGHKAVQVVDYVLCGRCKEPRCKTRDRADKDRRSRIRAIREGSDGHPGTV